MESDSKKPAIEAKPKRKTKWVPSGLNPEGKQMFKQVPETPPLKPGQIPPEPEQPRGEPNAQRPSHHTPIKDYDPYWTKD